MIRSLGEYAAASISSSSGPRSHLISPSRRIFGGSIDRLKDAAVEVGTHLLEERLELRFVIVLRGEEHDIPAQARDLGSDGYGDGGLADAGIASEQCLEAD